MAEIQPPESQINGGGGVVATSVEAAGSKRQRRPSVRLGDIGDQPYDSHVRRSNKHWKMGPDGRKDPDVSGKASKTRPVMNFSSGGGGGGGGGRDNETLDGEDKEGNLDSVAIGSWRVKDFKRRGTVTIKRVRSNWVSRIDEGGGGPAVPGGGGEGDERYSAGEDIEDGYRDFDLENSESPLKDQSPINLLDNLAVDGHAHEREVQYHGNRRAIRARGSEGREHHDGVELSGPSDTDGREWKCGERSGNDRGGKCGESSVRIWLNGLGLGRYAPVFEIHEVDDEVLPMLTLDDLKDMGINAVGSRRKMYCAIQKLGKGFS